MRWPHRRPRRRRRCRAGSGRCTGCCSIASTRWRTTTCARYAAELGLDLERFDADRASAGVLARVGRDVESGLASGEVLGTPTLFIDGVVHRGSYDAASLLQEVTVS